MTKPSSVQFYGKMTLLEIGQWKPITIIPLDDTATVAIDVPLTGDYVYNAEAYITGQLEANTPKPVWTKKGVQFIFDELNNMVNPTIKPEDFQSGNEAENKSEQFEEGW